MTTITPPSPKLLLSQREAAQMLSISPRTLFTLIKSGKLPAVRVGSGGIRIATSDLLRFVEQQRLS